MKRATLAGLSSLFLAAVFLALFLMVQSNVQAQSAGMPDPASVYCIQNGGEIKILTNEKGQYGVCVFPNGKQCEEWDLFRGECYPERWFLGKADFILSLKSASQGGFFKTDHPFNGWLELMFDMSGKPEAFLYDDKGMKADLDKCSFIISGKHDYFLMCTGTAYSSASPEPGLAYFSAHGQWKQSIDMKAKLAVSLRGYMGKASFKTTLKEIEVILTPPLPLAE